MLPWETLAQALAPDGTTIELRRRGRELLIVADGYDLMSSEDDCSSRALATLALGSLERERQGCILVGGLGMGFTLRAALDELGPEAIVEVAELIPAVAEWNRGPLAALAEHPLDDPRTLLYVGDVGERIRSERNHYDAILLDVDNGPDALAHDRNEGLYQGRGLDRAYRALRPGGVLAVWSFSDDPAFTRRLKQAGFSARVERVPASRKGRGRNHYIWLAQR